MRKQDMPSRKARNPHSNDSINAPCGCMVLPWPIVQVFGSDIEQLHCDTHGWQTLTKAWKARAKKQAKTLAAPYDPNEPIPF